MHNEVDSQPSKKSKKNSGQGSVALLKKSKQLGCLSEDIEPPKSKSILEKGTKSLGSKRSVRFSKDTLHPVKKCGKERVHRKELFRNANLTSVVLVLQKFEDRTPKETLQQERRVRREA